MSVNNLAVLTQSHKAIAAKKHHKRNQINEIVFDDDARRDFLTGFHKRKLAKAEAARSKAKERQKQERNETRREQRRMLREKALENSQLVENAYAEMQDVNDTIWQGISDQKVPDHAERDELYEDDHMHTTVTVVEDFDPDDIIHGPPVSKNAAIYPPSVPEPTQIKKPMASEPSKKKSKPKKVKYETKDARKKERSKQHARRTEKAELAGGKASRSRRTGHRGKRNGGSNR